MTDILEQLRDQSLQLARLSFDSVDAGLAANVADAAIDEIERLREVVEALRCPVQCTRKDTTVASVYFHTIHGAYAVTEDGKEWRLSRDEIKNALNAQPHK